MKEQDSEIELLLPQIHWSKRDEILPLGRKTVVESLLMILHLKRKPFDWWDW